MSDRYINATFDIERYDKGGKAKNSLREFFFIDDTHEASRGPSITSYFLTLLKCRYKFFLKNCFKLFVL